MRVNRWVEVGMFAECVASPESWVDGRQNLAFRV